MAGGAGMVWFAVTLDEPTLVKRVTFVPGKTFHDGGWFGASAGKPRIQVQRTNGGPWETVGELAAYPNTEGGCHIPSNVMYSQVLWTDDVRDKAN
jgi:hypothetical protein